MAALNATMRLAVQPAKVISFSSIIVVKCAQADAKSASIKLAAHNAIRGIIYKRVHAIGVKINVNNVKMDLVVPSAIMENISVETNVYLFLRDVARMTMKTIVLSVAKIIL